MIGMAHSSIRMKPNHVFYLSDVHRFSILVFVKRDVKKMVAFYVSLTRKLEIIVKDVDSTNVFCHLE